MRKEQIAIITLAVWLIVISVFMLLAHSVNLEIFFILSLISILVIVYLIEPNYFQPIYQKYIRYFIAAGIVIFVVIVAQKVLEILGFEIVF